MEFEIAVTEAIYWIIRFIQFQVYGCLVLFTLDNMYTMLFQALLRGPVPNIMSSSTMSSGNRFLIRITRSYKYSYTG